MRNRRLERKLRKLDQKAKYAERLMRAADRLELKADRIDGRRVLSLRPDMASPTAVLYTNYFTPSNQHAAMIRFT